MHTALIQKMITEGTPLPKEVRHLMISHHILGTGRLWQSPGHLAMFETDRDKIIKVIYSYATPIAWSVPGGDKLDDQPEWKLITKYKFTHSTRRHIRSVQCALGMERLSVTEI